MSYYEERLQSCLDDVRRRRAELRERGATPAELKADLELQRYRDAYRLYHKAVEEELYEREFSPVAS